MRRRQVGFMRRFTPSRPALGRTGFTMIELLVVVAVLALLISLVAAVASRAIRQQKVRNTQQIMQNVTLALEQFATENPLRAVYDKKGRETFGKFPPYQLANVASDSVGGVLEPTYSLAFGLPGSLEERLAWDLSGSSSGVTVSAWVEFPQSADGNDDIRALYTYLTVFSPGAIETIGEAALKPLYSAPADRDFVNRQGNGPVPGNEGTIDVLGIRDAWGVPLDYMLYVKCEWGLVQDPLTGATMQGFRVTQRKPVLRSLGIEREAYDAIVNMQSSPARRTFDSSKWLFSEDLPRPWARLADADDGVLNGGLGTQANGWVRAAGAEEDYAYLPDGDAD